MLGKFPCSQCGVCCKHIDNVDELRSYSNNGVCKFLDIVTNQCKIYHMRPEVCQVDSMYERYYRHIYSKYEFYNLNISVCNTLQVQDGIDSRFRIKLIKK